MKEEEIRAKFALIPLDRIEPNEGQLEGLPANPRDIVDRKVDLLKNSILMHPKMLELRGMMVLPLTDEKYIAIGGNMRWQILTIISKMSPAEINIALGKCSGYAQLSSDQRQSLRDFWAAWVKSKERYVPCGVIPKETPIEELKAYTILDNSGFGKWQWDMLANEWDAEQLTEWGVDLPIMESEIDTDEFFDDLDDDFEADEESSARVRRGYVNLDRKSEENKESEESTSDVAGESAKTEEFFDDEK